MRTLLAAVLAAAVLAPGLAAAAADSPETEAALEPVRAHMRAEKGVKFRKVKINAAGDVCGVYSQGGDRDIEFMLNKATGVIWVAEGPQEPRSAFNYGDPSVRRSDDRADYQAWKACSKG
ncbi:hypothetical protein [Caulobacter mirabilis]|uniref:Secreted protein n=1 Tax=Caulobacter mirabilis TaxID=69666 RepID=A0A2D2AXE1_9CAUL|nr:hypothetical protein [Caulobacter mirabilis]ATQ42607.1 hypothetical protein CSW64_09405 [Caulobacter mirabilis]